MFRRLGESVLWGLCFWRVPRMLLGYGFSMRPSRCLVLLLFLPLVLGAARTSETNPMSAEEDFQEGQRLYRINCGNCHGMEGTTGRGARLARRTYRHGNTDAELFDLIEGGIPGTDMPGLWLEEDDIWRILLFVRSFAVAASKGCEAGTGDASLGKEIFDSKASCGACHTVGKQGGRLGPDMSFAGVQYTNEQLRRALLEPARDVAKRYRTVRIVDADGQRVEGVWMNENAYHIYIMDRAENLRSFRKADLRSLEQPEESLMPGYGDMLSPSDLDNLLAYLCTLQGAPEEPAE